MFDNHTVLAQIENAERETPFCACGQPMVPVAREDGIWLECRSLETREGGPIARLLSVLAPHDRQLIVDDVAAAA
jgi:hypothetical protein